MVVSSSSREMPHDVSAVIVNYNAGAFLAACVGSLLRCAAQVIVVDNASSDDSVAQLETLFPGQARLRIIRNAKNLGFAKACNIGARASSSSHVLFLNPDCTLEDGVLQGLIDVLESAEDIGMVGGLLVNPNGSEQRGGRRTVPTPWRSFVAAFGLSRFADRWPRLFGGFNLHEQPLPAHPIEVEAISGACMLVRREAVAQVGLWDEGYFLHCEDVDWCMRFTQMGWKVMFVPAVRVTHAQGACSKSRPVFVEWHKHKSMVRFYRKFFRHQYSAALMWLVAAGVWFRFGVVVAYYSARRIGQALRFARG